MSHTVSHVQTLQHGGVGVKRSSIRRGVCKQCSPGRGRRLGPALPLRRPRAAIHIVAVDLVLDSHIPPRCGAERFRHLDGIADGGAGKKKDSLAAL